MARGNVTGPYAGPAGLLHPRPVTLVPAPVKPAPKGNITKKGSGSAGAARPKPASNVTAPRASPAGQIRPKRVVVQPPPGNVTAPRAQPSGRTPPKSNRVVTPKTISRSPAHTGAGTKQAVAANIVASNQIAAAAKALGQPSKVKPFTVDSPLVKRLARQGYLQIGPQTKAEKVAYSNAALKVQLQNPQLMMPGAVKILNYASRPIKAIAGATDVLVKGGSLSQAHHAATRGIEGKDNTLMSKVIKDLGGPKWLQAVGGFTADVVFDPTTYVGFGLAGKAQDAARLAGHGAEAEALTAGATAAEAQQAGLRAAEAVAQKMTPGRGLKFTMAGKEVPGVRAATATGARALKKVTPKPVKVAGGGVKTVAREFDPYLTPPGVSPEDHAFMEAIGGQTRGLKSKGLRQAQNTSRAIIEFFPTAQLKSDLYHAIETHDYSILPPSLRDKARELDQIYTDRRNGAVAAGVPVGDVAKSKIPEIPKVTADTKASGKAARDAVNARQVAERTQTNVKAARAHAKQTAKAHADTVALAAKQRAAQTKAYRDLAKAQGPEVAAAKKAYDQAVTDRARAVARETGPKILKGRSKTDLTKAQQDFPSANDIARVRSGQPGAPFELANKPREALTPVDIADRKVADAEARLVKAQREAGVAVGFVPHTPRDILEPEGGGAARVPEGSGRRTISGSTLKKRGDLRTIRAQNAETPGRLLEGNDVPLLNANYIATLSHAEAHGHFNQALASRGRRVEYGKNKDIPLHEGEALYVIHGANIHEVKPGEGKIADGKYYAINKALVDHHLPGVSATAQRGRTAEIFDHATGLWKKSKTFSLAFQARNAIGDTHMTWLVPGRSARRVAIETGQSIKVLRAQRAMDRAERALEHPKPSGLTVKVAGKRVPAEDVVRIGQNAGWFNTGYMASELPQLLGRSGEGAVTNLRKLVPNGSAISQLFNDRENLHRIGVGLHGLHKGLTPREAGALSRRSHIDYGNVTRTERGARRAMPFYTFTARGLPIFITALAKSPGKFATYEKLLEETSKATGVNLEDAYKRLQQFELQQIPLIIGGHGVKIPDVTPTSVAAKVAGVSDPLGGATQASWSDPSMLLNWVPDPAHPKESGQFLADQFMSMINPIPKTLVEAKANYSFFAHRPINDPNAPLVAAPSWVKYLPDSAKKFLHVVPDYIDKQTGKRVWGWSGGAQYAMGQMPALVSQASGLLTQGTSQRGQDTKQKALAAITGVKVSPVTKPQVNTINRLLHEYYNINTPKINTFHQRGIYAANATPEYRRLLDRQKAIVTKVQQLSAQTGRAVPIFTKHTGKPPSALDKLSQSLGVGAGKSGTADLDALAKKLGVAAPKSQQGLDALAKKLGVAP